MGGSTFSIKGKFEGDELVSGLRQVQDELSDTQKAAKNAGGKLGDMLNQKNSTTNYRRQLMSITKELQDLIVNYRLLGEADRNSEFGVQLSQRIDELTQKAALYKDAMLDAQASIGKSASDTANWDALSSAIDITGSALETFVGLSGMSEDSAQALMRVLAQMKTAEAAVNTVIKVGNALQKESALMLGIRRAQESAAALATKLHTRATMTQTVATKGATIAQKALNVAANANPYVLLASAVIAVGTALFAFAKNSSKAAKEEEELNEELEKSKEKMDSFSKAVGSAAGTAAYKFDELSTKFAELNSQSEKQSFIETYKSTLDELGISLNNVADAEDVLIKNKDKFREAILAKAEASALQGLIEEAYKDYYTQVQSTMGLVPNYQAGQSVHTGQAGFEALTFGGLTNEWSHMGASGGTLTEQGAKQMREAAVKAAVEPIQEAFQATINELQSFREGALAKTAILNSISPSTTPTSNNSKAEDLYNEGSLRKAEQVVSEIKDKINNIDVSDSSGVADLLAQLAEAEADVERIKKILYPVKEEKEKVADVPVFSSGSVAEAEHFIAFFKKELDNMNPDDDNFQETLSLLKAWENSLENIKKKYGEVADKQAEVKDENITFKDQIEDVGNIISGIGSGVGSINSVYEAFKSLGSELEDAENGWESFMAVFGVVMTTLESACGIIKTVTSLTEIFTGITEALTAAKEAHALATTTETSANLAEAASEGTVAAASTATATAKSVEAGANTAAAASGAASAMASIPYVGPILAVAAVAAVLGAIIAAVSKSKKFAAGGIVGGASKIGDFNLARVNSGEMILNSKQQENLWKIINKGDTNGVSGVGQVEFKIKGSELVGVITNYNKRKERV